MSVTVVDQLLEKHNYRKRKAQRRLSSSEHPQRNEQFENIEELIESYQAAGKPVLSMDTKKRIHRAAIPRWLFIHPRGNGSTRP